MSNLIFLSRINPLAEKEQAIAFVFFGGIAGLDEYGHSIVALVVYICAIVDDDLDTLLMSVRHLKAVEQNACNGQIFAMNITRKPISKLKNIWKQLQQHLTFLHRRYFVSSLQCAEIFEMTEICFLSRPLPS